MRQIPTTLLRCDPTKDENACGLLQMAHTVPQPILYSCYWYSSGINQTMRDHLSSVANEATDLVRGNELRVLDIGCNDGTLLKAYPESFTKFGVDPSDVAKQIKGDIRVVQDVFPSKKLEIETCGRPFDIITSIAMFYDLEDPVAFSKAVKACLAQEGIWVLEMSYMPTMLKMNSYDTICHEHLEYYSLTVIEEILKRSDLKLIKASLNNINGGSIRCYVTHAQNSKFDTEESAEILERMGREEFELELDTDKPYVQFQERINAHREGLMSLLMDIKRAGKTIHVYGASTKGNTILQWCNIDNSLVDFAADRNPEKHGARTLGTDIPIISEEESRAKRPDYYLVLPWHFKGEFLTREKRTLETGTSLIFPLPNVEIVEGVRSR